MITILCTLKYAFFNNEIDFNVSNILTVDLTRCMKFIHNIYYKITNLQNKNMLVIRSYYLLLPHSLKRLSANRMLQQKTRVRALPTRRYLNMQTQIVYIMEISCSDNVIATHPGHFVKWPHPCPAVCPNVLSHSRGSLNNVRDTSM